MCWISVPRGCLLCICSFNVSLNIFFGYWAHSSPAAGSAWLPNNLLHFWPRWAEQVLAVSICWGAVWVAFVCVFQIEKKLKEYQPCFPPNLSPCIFQMLSWKRACSENWQIIVQWPGGNDRGSSFIMQILRCLQKCGKLKMMAVVRTSLQKVVVLLHRLQRMAVSSPRYQKLCKVTEWLKTGILGADNSTVSWACKTNFSGSYQGKVPFLSNWL